MTIELDPKALTAQEIWNSPQLAVIVPRYKERDNIAPLYDKVTAELGGIPFEFIVVDDNSPDGTAAVVDVLHRVAELAEERPTIRRLELNPLIVAGATATATDVTIDLAPATDTIPEHLRRLG